VAISINKLLYQSETQLSLTHIINL